MDRHRDRHRTPQGKEFSLRKLEHEASAALTLLESIEVAAPVGFKFVDRDLRIVRMNPLLARVNGLPVTEQVGRTVAEVVPDLWPRLEAIYRPLVDTVDDLISAGGT